MDNNKKMKRHLDRHEKLLAYERDCDKNAKVSKTYEGLLDTYWETGYGDGLYAHLYLPKTEYKNENYDPKNPNSGPEFFRSFNGMVSIERGDIIEITNCPHDPTLNGSKFIIGNQKMGSQDHFNLGRVYPEVQKNQKNIDLKDWKRLFLSTKVEANVIKKMKKVCLYGGTFDPVHEGHKSIISELSILFDEVLVLVGNNWTKTHQPLFTLDERLKSVEAVADNYKNVKVLDWAKNCDTSSTYDMSQKVKDLYGFSPYIVIGSDNLIQLPKWKNYKELKKSRFVVVSRKGYEVDMDKYDKMNVITLKSYNPVSSTEIRSSHNESLIPLEARKCLDLTKLK